MTIITAIVIASAGINDKNNGDEVSGLLTFLPMPCIEYINFLIYN